MCKLAEHMEAHYKVHFSFLHVMGAPLVCSHLASRVYQLLDVLGDYPEGLKELLPLQDVTPSMLQGALYTFVFAHLQDTGLCTSKTSTEAALDRHLLELCAHGLEIIHQLQGERAENLEIHLPVATDGCQDRRSQGPNGQRCQLQET